MSSDSQRQETPDTLSGIPDFNPTTTPKVKTIPAQKRGIIKNIPKGVRFGEGQPNNKGGRPKTAIFRTEALKYLEANPDQRLAIIKRLIKTKPEFLVQLVDGKLVDTVNLQNPDGTGIFQGAAESASLFDLKGELIRRGALTEAGRLVLVEN